MQIKGLIDEDLVNYKVCSMYIIFPNCSFKCDKECGTGICQNENLVKTPIIEMEVAEICERYKSNALSQAIVLAGLEPFDSPYELLSLVDCFRNSYKIEDDIIIYTGYTEDEIISGESIQERFGGDTS